MSILKARVCRLQKIIWLEIYQTLQQVYENFVNENNRYGVEILSDFKSHIMSPFSEMGLTF